MIIYIIYILIILILAFISVIAAKAIIRGVEAKKNKNTLYKNNKKNVKKN